VIYPLASVPATPKRYVIDERNEDRINDTLRLVRMGQEPRDIFLCQLIQLHALRQRPRRLRIAHNLAQGLCTKPFCGMLYQLKELSYRHLTPPLA
jgi:hypothetical protein